MIDPLLLAFLELTLVMTLIMLLHSVRELIGSPAFYLSVALFLVLGQIVSAFGIQIDPGIGGLKVDVGNVVLTSPFLVALLLVYVLDGTLEAQQVIMGFLALLVGYLCLSLLLSTQFTLPGYTSRTPELFDYLSNTFTRGRRVINATFAASAIDLFVLPVLYQFFQNRRCRLFISVLGTLIFTQVIDSFVVQLLLAPQLTNWWDSLRASYLARAGAMLWLSVLASVYLKMARGRLPETRRPSLDLIFAFLGAYRRAEILRRNLVEWEGRYSTVVEHTSDWIFVMDRDGVLISANAAAREHVGTVSDRDRRAPELFSGPDGGAIGWESLWTEICERATEAAGSRSLSREWATHASAEQAKPEAPLQLDVQISPATLEGTLVAIGIARDVTEQRRIERDRQALQERLATIQRLESVGLLAGGIAHDFNNLLHTVQAAIERLRAQQDGPEKTHELLQTIEHAAERASRLTSHLLGFARQGKYNPERVLLQELLEEVRSLFDPLAGDAAEFRLVRTPESIYLTADRRQLEQVLLNMLINSRDAVRETDRAGRIVLRGERASHHTPGWSQRPPERADANPANFCCIRVKDNGVGVPEDVRNTLFDPFVTTKEVGQGTGMGLAMAYGCITHHEGWIHLESNARGTEFLVYLPCSR